MEFFFICKKSYHFIDEQGIEHKGCTAYLYNSTENDIVKARCDDDCKDYKFGEPVVPDIVVKGRYAKYILA